ncbi:Hypothetical predicted protein [Podarcis lilfordi]|uniref:Uncharacterized protein n=1 Tax=Podarcis lilfordi TaxID=74358 RepID=A0AA35NU52_9SAUR|nr:Hypothetical predicted protein [Podarcis lilfordi]
MSEQTTTLHKALAGGKEMSKHHFQASSKGIGSSPTIQNRRKQACSICHVTALEIFEDGYHISSVSSFPALNSEHHAGPMASSSVGFIRRHQTLNTYSPTLLQRK